MQYELRITPFKTNPISPRPSSFVVSVNGDEIARSGTAKIACRAIMACLGHYDVEIDKKHIRALIQEAELCGFVSHTFTKEEGIEA